LAGKVVHLLLQEGRGLLLVVVCDRLLLVDSPALLPLVGVLLIVVSEPLFFPRLLLYGLVGGVLYSVVSLSLNDLSVVLERLLRFVPCQAEWIAGLFQYVLAYELTNSCGCQPISPGG